MSLKDELLFVMYLCLTILSYQGKKYWIPTEGTWI